jgi:hypothetical protein
MHDACTRARETEAKMHSNFAGLVIVWLSALALVNVAAGAMLGAVTVDATVVRYT